MKKLLLALILLSPLGAAAQSIGPVPPANLPPSGAAGGDLGGTYPNPTVVNGSHITNASIPNSGLATPAPCSAFGTTAGTCAQGSAFLPLAGGTLTGTETISSASLILSGNQSAAAWTTGGIRYANPAVSYTDTSSSGTVTAAYTDLFGVSTILASNPTTYTTYYGTYFKAPVASTNVTISNNYALGADSASFGNISVSQPSGFSNTVFNSGSGGGWELTYQGSSSTQPTIIPNRADLKAGIGAAANGNVTIIGDNSGTATEMINVTGTTIALFGLANTATTSAVCYNTGTGVVTYDGTVGTCTTSDERLKNMGERVPNALARLLQINGVYYTWKDPTMGSGRQIGVGAQTVERVFPELVETDSTGKKSADYQRLTAPIIEALRQIVDSCHAAPTDGFCVELIKRSQ